jgi:hypothetical protein
MLRSPNNICIAGRLVVIQLLIIILILPAKGQQINTAGKDFWLAFLQNNDAGKLRAKIKLTVYITSETNISGIISMPLKGWSQAFNVNANEGIKIIIPTDSAMSDTTEIVEQRGVHITADSNIRVWALNTEPASTDGTNVLPTSTLGDTPEYIVASYWGFWFEPADLGLPSEFIIVSNEDNTEISITPSVKTVSEKPANVPFIINLNKGETYQLMAMGSMTKKLILSDFTGTLVKTIKGSCSVFSGATCVDIDTTHCAAGDHIYKQCYPVNSWGKEYILTPFMSQTNGYFYKVIASEDNTKLTIPGQSPMILNSGKSYYANATTADAIYVSADKPIAVAQYMKGCTCNGYNNKDGDPAMLLLNSNNQLLNKAVFMSAATTLIDTLEFINIITKTANDDKIMLDCQYISASKFNPVPSLNTYSYATLRIDSGIHTIMSDSGFIAYAYGAGAAESYLWSLGIGASNIRTGSLSISADPSSSICTGESVTFTATSTTACMTPLSYEWYKGNEKLAVNNEQLNLNNISEADAGSYYCVAVNSSNTFTSNTVVLTIDALPVISFITPPMIKCSRDSVMFKIATSSLQPDINYQWSKNGTLIQGATSSTYIKSILMQNDEGTYSCIVSNTCSSTSANTILTFGSVPTLKDTIINLTKNTGDSLTISITPRGTRPFAYQWLKNDSNISGATNFKLTLINIQLRDSGKYSCMVSNICGNITSQTLTLKVQKEVNINELRMENGELRIKIQPNPTNSLLVVSYSLLEKNNVNFSIYDMMGREVERLVDGRQEKGEHIIKFNTEGITSGTYFYKLTAGNKFANGKIVVIKN